MRLLSQVAKAVVLERHGADSPIKVESEGHKATLSEGDDRNPEPHSDNGTDARPQALTEIEEVNVAPTL